MRKPSKAARYGVVVALSMRDMLSRGTYIVAWMVATLALSAVTMLLYVTAYQASSPSLPLAAAVWSLAIASFIRLTWRHLTGMVVEGVHSGAVALEMRYPLSYLGVIFFDHVGRSIPTLLSTPLLFLLAYSTSGLPTIPVPLLSIAMFIPMVVGSFLLSSMMYILLGLLAFWMEDSMPVLWIVEKTSLVIGGSVVPLALLPATARNVIEYIPMAAPGFPAQLVMPDFADRAPQLLAIQWGWIAFFGALLAWTWYRAQKRIEVNGG